MSAKRIVACLDIDNGRVVKGKKFEEIKDVADPLELAKHYSESGVDELVFYDITASTENRGVFIELVALIAKNITVSFTVGGGIRTTADIQQVLDAGADKVSINSAAIERPEFIQEAADTFGSDRIVFAMDVKEIAAEQWTVHAKGGRSDTGIDAIERAKLAEQLGAGEIVVNAIDTDGVKDGYHIKLTKRIADSVSIPVVASGGAGKMEHFFEALTEGGAAAALAASVFHYGEISIPDLKNYLNGKISEGGDKNMRINIDHLIFNSEGLLPAIVQDASSGEVLTLAYMNKESVVKTIETNETWFYSRSRKKLWNKGETSGNRQIVKRISYDCDQDALLVQAEPLGPACHKGETTCFHQTLYTNGLPERNIISHLVHTIKERKQYPAEGTYTSYLFKEGIDKILKKVGEESSEVIIASKNNDLTELTGEMADLTYHMLVLMEETGVTMKDIKQVLTDRHIQKEGKVT